MTNPVVVEGVKQVQHALDKIEKADLKKANAEVAAIVATEAKAIVPRRSGDLADTIRSSGQAKAGVVRAGFARVPYAGPIHFGWPHHNIAPNPFLYKAADRRVDEVVESYAKALAKIADETGIGEQP